MSRRRITSRARIQLLGLLMLMGIGALGLKLWWIQVAHGQEWTSQLRGSSQATVRIPSVRGEIKDRNGLTLVQNRASYEVDFYLPEMVKGFRERFGPPPLAEHRAIIRDRKSTRLNSSHGYISYAVFCLKKKRISSAAETANHAMLLQGVVHDLYAVGELGHEWSRAVSRGTVDLLSIGYVRLRSVVALRH